MVPRIFCFAVSERPFPHVPLYRSCPGFTVNHISVYRVDFNVSAQAAVANEIGTVEYMSKSFSGKQDAFQPQYPPADLPGSFMPSPLPRIIRFGRCQYPPITTHILFFDVTYQRHNFSGNIFFIIFPVPRVRTCLYILRNAEQCLLCI